MEIDEQIKELNNTVWCRLGQSTIHGVGVIAIRNIPNRTKITNYDVYKMYEADNYTIPLDRMKEIIKPVRDLIMDRMMFDVNSASFKFKSPNADASLVSFMNHSDNPNYSPTIGCRTLRNIKKGEELTEDFNKLFYSSPHPLTKQHLKGCLK